MEKQRMSAGSRKVRKMTRDGLVEKDLAEHSSVNISRRAGEMKLSRSRKPDGNGQNLTTRSAGGRHPGKGKGNSPRGPTGEKQDIRAGKQRRTIQEGEAPQGREPGYPVKQHRARGRKADADSYAGADVPDEKARLKNRDGYGEKLYEKKAELFQSRGDAGAKSLGAKHPMQKKRLRFAQEERGEAGEAIKETAKEKGHGNTVQDGAGASGKQGKAAAGAPKERRAGAAAQTEGKARKHSVREKVYREEAPAGKKARLRFEAEPEGKNAAGNLPAVRKAALAGVAAAHREIRGNGQDNAAVEGADQLLEAGAAGYFLADRSIRTRKQRRARRLSRKTDRSEVRKLYEKALSEDGRLKQGGQVRRFLQKQRIKKEYAKAKHAEQAMGTATVGTIDYIKKIGGKVTDFFKENRKLYASLALLIGLMLLIMSSLGSCAALFMQNTVDYTGLAYQSTDDAIREADLYYTQLEAKLQERVDQMEAEEPGHEEYRYNIGPIEHDPFVLISYLSAKYEVFTFDEVKAELDELFALQYSLNTEAVSETVTEKRTVKVGEALGQVVTSGYCSCPICCGVWSGGPTASGTYPTANHTIAVDASAPFVPMGTKVVMNGVEYTVEDTGGFAQYGVQFDVYYDSHAEALAHGHQTWEAYIADDNGSQEVEVTATRAVDTLNVTLEGRSLMAICQERLDPFQKELFGAYNETKGNLQMFGTPFEFNWYGRAGSYYGWRIHPVTGEMQIHNGLDIGVPSGTSVKAGLTGTVTASSYNDSYGNYVILEDSDGYELRYAHLESRGVAAGDSVTKGDEIGLAGSTGSSTGSHLHIELLKDGERMNPIFYLETGSGTIAGGNEYTSEAAQRLLAEAEKYLGVPYVWGGYSPSGFDCSGFVSYCLVNSGVRNTGRLTAQGLYNICTPVPESEVQPGDLIFFTGTYDAGEPVTHIGIYAGNGQMIHCGHPVQYTSIYSPYWQSHFYGFGRW